MNEKYTKLLEQIIQDMAINPKKAIENLEEDIRISAEQLVIKRKALAKIKKSGKIIDDGAEVVENL